MSIIEVAIKDIRPNPFKKFINEGKLDEDRLEKLKESIEHGTLPEIFACRKVDGDYQQAYGHHRLKALERIKGKDYKVKVDVVDYSDEQMLVDLVRENVTQRDTDAQDTIGAIQLTYYWVNSKASTVKQLYSAYKSGKHLKGKEGSESLPDSCRSIKKLLSKNGKAISHVTINKYFNIAFNLDSKIREKVGKLHYATDDKFEEQVGVDVAARLATVKKRTDQNILLKEIKKKDLGQKSALKLVSVFKNAEENVKQKVREGKLDLADLERQDVQQAEFFEEDEGTPESWEKAEGLKKAFNQAQNSWQKVLILLADFKIMKDYNYGIAEINSFIKDIKDVEPFANDAIKKLSLVKSK